MVEVVDELKSKLAEIDAKTEELRREIVALEAQKSAFETVIRVYDPSFELAAPPSKGRRASSRETASGRVTELLKGRNNRHIVLDILRRSESRRQRLKSPSGSPPRATLEAKRHAWNLPSPVGSLRR